MNKILLVDDDRELTSLLKELLDMEGFNVLVAHDGEQALSLLDDSIDLLLLDVMMPKKNGIDTLKELRQTHQTPVIMLTARGSELDRVLGLELGADDYLPKPFNDRELVARIRAILRRSHWSEQQQNTDNSSPTLEVDSLSLNPGRQEASFDGQTLELTGTEFTLLYLLAQHLGQVVSREHLSQEVLGKRLTPFDRAIDMHISNLRRKLPERKDGHPWFKTLRGRGYLMLNRPHLRHLLVDAGTGFNARTDVAKTRLTPDDGAARQRATSGRDDRAARGSRAGKRSAKRFDVVAQAISRYRQVGAARTTPAAGDQRRPRDWRRSQ
ncbi:hypothetical protein Lal_00009217 [Lupinus albus]|nr:hypothetical protein Lal_00009217 [Lupinus albus]